jgi:aminoglycoside phosphotransferase (APT) family kinase protein
MVMVDEDAVRRYVGEERVVDIQRFEAGERHATYRVRLAAEDPVDVVVRVSLTDTPDERAHASREATVLRVVGGDVAPRLLDVQCPSDVLGVPVLSLSFVEGVTRDFASASQDELTDLGRVVAEVHSFEPPSSIDDVPDLATYAEHRTRTILATADSSIRDPLDVATQRRVHRLVEALSARPAPRVGGDALVLLHGDVAPGNVLWSSDGPVLIDWEYARLGDPADEIAYVFGQNELPPDLRAAFWRGYGATTEAMRERVAWWEPLVSLGSARWWLDRWFARTAADAAGIADPSAPKPAGHYLGPALRRLAAAERLVDAGGDPA